MAEQNQEGRIGQHWARWGRWVAIALAAIVVLIAFYGLYWIPWSGFGGYRDSTGEWQPGKTLWDWLDLCLVPVVLAGLAAGFSWWQNKREHNAEERRVEADRVAQERRARDAALQAYLDRMTELLEKGLRESEPGDVKRSIARARTLAVLRQLDRERKGLLLRFPYESDLIGGLEEEEEQPREPIVDLFGADLREADLREAYLAMANLDGAYLAGANLSGANLSGAYLFGAYLSKANLSGAILSKAILGMANLIAANLAGAYLGGADLHGAEVTHEQLAKAETLEAATLPDGTKYSEATSKQPEPVPPPIPVIEDTEEQPDVPGDLDAGEEVSE